jgi:hypothetical protein
MNHSSEAEPPIWCKAGKIAQGLDLDCIASELWFEAPDVSFPGFWLTLAASGEWLPLSDNYSLETCPSTTTISPYLNQRLDRA